MFKDRLKQARKASGYTQESLAAAIGVKKSTISGYESGNSEPDMDKIVKLMGLLKVDANFLYQDEMNAAPDPTFSAAALELARLYDSLDTHSQRIVYTIAQMESSRTPAEPTEPLPKGIMPIGRLPLYSIPYLGEAKCDGSIETKYAAKQKLRELQAETENTPVET